MALRKAVAARSVTSRAHLRVAKRDRRQSSAGQATRGAAFFGCATPPMRPVAGTMLPTAAGIDERTGRGHGLVDVLRPGPSRTGQGPGRGGGGGASQSRPQAGRPVPRRVHRRPGNRPSPEPTRGSSTTAAAATRVSTPPATRLTRKAETLRQAGTRLRLDDLADAFRLKRFDVDLLLVGAGPRPGSFLREAVRLFERRRHPPPGQRRPGAGTLWSERHRGMGSQPIGQCRTARQREPGVGRRQ